MSTITFEFTDDMVCACESATGLKGDAAVERVVQQAIEPLHKQYCVQKDIAPARVTLNAALDKIRADDDKARATFKAVLVKAQADAAREFQEAIT